MPPLTYAISASGVGSSISSNINRNNNSGGFVEYPVPKGFAGTLTTRTDDETGTLTLDAGHGISTGDVIDLYWAGGGRYKITVGTVSGNTVPIGADDSGTGDVLPAAATAIVASPRVGFLVLINNTGISLFACQQFYSATTETAVSHVFFDGVSGSNVATLDLTANTPRIYDITGGDTNIFASSAILTITASNGSSTNDATLKLLWSQDATV